MDMISKLPPGIIETILCLLPIQEAARTSILSKQWRYHWIKIPKLEFIQDTFQESTDDGAEMSVMGQMFDQLSLRKDMTKRHKIFNAIHQVMLNHEGPIHEFTLSMEMESDDSWFDIDRIMSQLSKKKTVKKLTLDFMSGYRLALFLFSLHQLTDLYLIACELYYQKTLNGFVSLTTLFMQDLWTSKKTLLHLLSSCPLLKTLDIKDITIEDDNVSTIINLFECLPVIENLSFCFRVFEYFAKDGVPQVLPTALVHLKNLCLEDICFIHKHGLPILVLLIRSSLKLEKLKLEILDDVWVEESERKDSVTLEDYSDISLEHLNELEIKNFIYRKTELDFVKVILAKSPVLKKVKIFLYNEVAKDGVLEISRILLHSLCASQMVEIIVDIVEGSCTNYSRSVM